MGYIGAREELSIMSTKRRTMSPEFKAKVTLEAIRGLTTVNELANQIKNDRLPRRYTRILPATVQGYASPCAAVYDELFYPIREFPR